MTVKMVQLEWQGDPPNVYYPACGAAIYEMNQDPTKCPHVLFALLDLIGDFDYVANQ